MGGGANLAATLPGGLSHLHDLAAALASAPVVPGERLRVWVTVPTMQFAIAAATLGALTARTACASCPHCELQDGVRVSVYLDGKFRDANLGRDGEMWRYAGVRIPADRVNAHRLPDAFSQERAATVFDEQLRSRVASAYGCPRDLAGHKLLAASAHPVLVVGGPAPTATDVSALAERVDDPDIDAWAANEDIDQWYRRPVLTTGLGPTVRRHPWLANVRPRLVITITAATSNVQTPWPQVPVLSLLSRRSPSSVGAADLASLASGRPAAGLAEALNRALRPGNGLEICAMLTPPALADEFAGGDPEDLW